MGYERNQTLCPTVAIHNDGGYDKRWSRNLNVHPTHPVIHVLTLQLQELVQEDIRNRGIFS